MIAGGNAVVIKPSEQLPAFNELIAQLIPQYLDKDFYQVVQGGREEMTKVRCQSLRSSSTDRLMSKVPIATRTSMGP